MKWLRRIVEPSLPIPSTWEHLGQGTYLDRSMYSNKLIVLHFQLMLMRAEKAGREFYERE